MNNALEIALKAIEQFKGCKTFEYRGECFPCSKADDITVETLKWGGFSEKLTTILNVRKSVFVDGINPQNNETVVFNGQTFFVLKVIEDGLDTFLQIGLTKKN